MSCWPRATSTAPRLGGYHPRGRGAAADRAAQRRGGQLTAYLSAGPQTSRSDAAPMRKRAAHVGWLTRCSISSFGYRAGPR